jgi:hypothetical protein
MWVMREDSVGFAARDAWTYSAEILDQLGHPDAEQIRAKLLNLDDQDRGNEESGRILR